MGRVFAKQTRGLKFNFQYQKESFKITWKYKTLDNSKNFNKLFCISHPSSLFSLKFHESEIQLHFFSQTYKSHW